MRRGHIAIIPGTTNILDNLFYLQKGKGILYTHITVDTHTYAEHRRETIVLVISRAPPPHTPKREGVQATKETTIHGPGVSNVNMLALLPLPLLAPCTRRPGDVRARQIE